ncbi:toxin co-regulated pilus biosynthesis Q family protein [Roseateles sp. SL47]|uniref:toxin co-regulated pilus biosynthesis Q family protein n=1 Tax=Roseateles sp. SL47 TaxID=2995138 RepID=UPI002270EB86|nr:toxin co-regulated pilus biosynthesis Q family protein [Roseateles sp. SL47]WAC74556.1 toxin co-regulated pilus biosynthesis Q family protein [Roseateles sp. SL47]
MSGTDRAFGVLANDGQAVPLRKALEQLAPMDYGVRWVGVDATRMNAPVTWQANQTWPDAIGEAVKAVPGLVVHVATGSRLILVRAVSDDLRPLPPTPATVGKVEGPATPAATTRSATAASPSPATARVAPTLTSLPAAPAASPVPDPGSAASTPAPTPLKEAPRPRLMPAKFEGSAAPRTSSAGPQSSGASSINTPATGTQSSGMRPTVLETVSVSGRRTEPPAVQRWSLSEDDRTLRVALDRWAQQAGWRLFWEMGVDYPITASASINGNFEDAISMVVRSLEQADVPPKAIFYRGNQVLRVIPRGKE